MILVTGATGFLGKNFVFEHTKTSPVKILVRQTSDTSLFKDNSNVIINSGDLIVNKGIAQALDDVEIVIHCAARTNGSRFNDFYCDNVVATRNLIEAMKRKSVDKLLLISTQSAGGPCCSEEAVNETTPSHPVSFYGLSKKMAEDVVRKSGLQYNILRPCSVYGPYDMEILKFIKLIKRGFYPIIGGGNKCVSLVYVKDLVKLMQVIVERGLFNNKTYYVSDGNCYQYDEVVQEICRILNRKYCFKVSIPESFAYIFGLLNDLLLPQKRMLVGFDKIRDMSKDFWICENSRIIEESGWTPEYDLNKGMEETIRWYQKNDFLGS
ncbi:MAG: NAD(P)-dependent oxidoreductase [candidate division WOR-3 bacterium]